MHMQDPVHPSNSCIGIDVGVIHFATLNDGQHIAPINSLKQKEKALAKYQKRLSRKQRFSKNWHKARKKVAKVHRDIRHVRSDFLHKVSTDLCKKHAVICIEDLNIKKMTASHKGTQENPGQYVSQKSRLNKRILDQGWGLFRRLLEYKTRWLGAKLIQVPPRYTSQECPSCGHIASMNRASQAKFHCSSCHYENNADCIGALNILERGLRLLACGETMHVGCSMKQEPTEVC